MLTHTCLLFLSEARRCLRCSSLWIFLHACEKVQQAMMKWVEEG